MIKSYCSTYKVSGLDESVQAQRGTAYEQLLHQKPNKKVIL